MTVLDFAADRLPFPMKGSFSFLTPEKSLLRNARPSVHVHKCLQVPHVTRIEVRFFLSLRTVTGNR